MSEDDPKEKERYMEALDLLALIAHKSEDSTKDLYEHIARFFEITATLKKGNKEDLEGILRDSIPSIKNLIGAINQSDKE